MSTHPNNIILTTLSLNYSWALSSYRRHNKLYNFIMECNRVIGLDTNSNDIDMTINELTSKQQYFFLKNSDYTQSFSYKYISTIYSKDSVENIVKLLTDEKIILHLIDYIRYPFQRINNSVLKQKISILLLPLNLYKMASIIFFNKFIDCEIQKYSKDISEIYCQIHKKSILQSWINSIESKHHKPIQIESGHQKIFDKLVDIYNNLTKKFTDLSKSKNLPIDFYFLFETIYPKLSNIKKYCNNMIDMIWINYMLSYNDMVNEPSPLSIKYINTLNINPIFEIEI